MAIIILLVLVGICAWFIYNNESLKNENKTLQSQLSEFKAENASLKTKKENLEENLKKSEKGPSELKTIFENLANKILKDNTETFSKSSKKDIDSLLKPLETKIDTFQQGVEGRQQQIFSLKEEVKNLVTTKESLAKETQSLTKALKYDVKNQGIWGERVLEKILESSGLKKGTHYILQGKGMALKNEQGERLHPDVLVNLPDGKQIVIDSKVSLKTYTDFKHGNGNKDDLFTSVRNHIDSLSGKNYQFIDKLVTPEFVVMFFPLEGVLPQVMDMSVPNQNKALMEYAWDNFVVLLTPSNLMATLKTIDSLWRIDKQNKNAQKIAEESGKLYNTFKDFLTHLEVIGKNIEDAQKSYDSAKKKLTGKGNMISKAERIKELGAKATKNISKHWNPDSLIEGDDK